MRVEIEINSTYEEAHAVLKTNVVTEEIKQIKNMIESHKKVINNLMYQTTKVRLKINIKLLFR